MRGHMGNFTFHKTEIDGVCLIDVKTYGDSRGYFMETYKESEFLAAGLNYRFIQDNQSLSRRGVIRGLHFQKKYSQAKLVRVLRGEVFDVAVDFRKGSTTYGKWIGVYLSEENHRQFLIPKGFAHGFAVVSEEAVFSYKCDELYHPEDEDGIIWNDPDINIEWPDVGEIILSEKDTKYKTLRENHVEYEF